MEKTEHRKRDKNASRAARRAAVRAALEATRARLGLPPLSSAPEAQWLPPRPPPRFVLAEREWDWMY